VRLSAEEVVALDFHDPQREAEYRRHHGKELAMGKGMNLEEGHVYFCGGGVHSLAVDPAGRMSICVLSHYDTYDWRSGTFADAWQNFFPKVRYKPRTRPSRCDKCRIHSLCSMCPANGELENGDAEKPVEFLCQVAHLRALALGIAIPAHGPCPNCAPGEQRADLERSAERIRRREIAVGEWTPAPPLLPVLREGAAAVTGCGSGRCGSCSPHS
jgi:radical SAM protein with 4Fe4S-binding SPASM domain